MKWRGIVEVNIAVDAKNEEDAKRKIAAQIVPADVIAWCEEQ